MESAPPNPLPGALRLGAARLLALAAAGVAGYLWSQSGGSVAGCDALADFDCDAALSSRWATWLGVAVSIVGAACYAAMFLGACLIGRRPDSLDATGWRIVELTVPMSLASAAWFIGLQATGASPACLFCLAAHGCGVTASALLLWQRLRSSRSEGGAVLAPVAAPAAATTDQVVPPPALGVPTLLGVLAIAALVVGQIVAPPEVEAIAAKDLDLTFDNAVSTPPPEAQLVEILEPEQLSDNDASPTSNTASPARRRDGSRELTLLNGRLTLDVYEHPVLGSPEAPYVVVELMDYACPHCHEFAKMLEEAMPRYGDQLAVVLLPVPGELLCNKYVKRVRPKARGDCKVTQAAMALAQSNPDAFPQLHKWLLGLDSLPTWGRTLSRARDLGGEAVDEAFVSPPSKERVAKNIEIYGVLAKAGASALPCQILQDTVVPGKPSSLDKLYELWEEHLGVRPLDTL